MKVLDQEAFAFIVQEHAKNKSYREIAALLNNMGYAKASGAAIDGNYLPSWLIPRGYSGIKKKIIAPQGRKKTEYMAQEVKHKRLDKQAFIFAKSQHQKGVTYEQICLDLAEHGYVTQQGRPMSDGNLSNFMLKRGYRVKHKARRRSRNTIAVSTPKAQGASLKDLKICIIKADLTPTQKLSLLDALG